MKIEGITRVEDLINNLPQAFADLGGNLSNGSTGTATVNLRNLGPQRTLVLVNSRRLMPGDPTQNGSVSPDLNQIPASLIERVEVLSGGASAVYGADAVAGVVNFIMNDNFEGVRLDAQYSLYQHKNDSDVASTIVRDRAASACRTATSPMAIRKRHHLRRRYQHAGRPRQRDGVCRLPPARCDQAGSTRLQRLRAGSSAARARRAVHVLGGLDVGGRPLQLRDGRRRHDRP